MALYRSKLGPVGGGSGSKTKEGGIAVDLDPLSAFALMGGGSGEGDKGHQQNDAPSSDTRGTHPSSKGETMRPRRGESDSVSSPLAPPGSVEKTQGFESWHLADLDDLLPASQPSIASGEAVEITGYPRGAPSISTHVLAPTPRAIDRHSSGFSNPSPPRQLQQAHRDDSQFGSWRAVSIGSMGGTIPSVEDFVGHEALVEKIDPLEILKVEGIECLAGELLLVKLQNACVEGLHGKMVPGVLIMTTYKLVIIPHKLAQRGMSAQGDSSGTDERYLPFGHLPKEFLQIPMTYIDRVERDSDRKGSARVDRYFNGEGIATVHCKDARRLRVLFGGPEESERALKMLQQLAFPGQQMEHLFAYSHHTLDPGLPDPGWYIYDPQKEFDRMGVLQPRRNSASPWRTTSLNEKYGLCASYPNVLVVPASVTDVEIEAVSQFRSEQRLPVLCWGRQADSASIWRSSQPKIGISRATCAEDERMLGRLASSSPSRILPIVDCRPRSTATANFAAGYGYESYADCPLEFFGIGNIHVMRESLAKLENLCLSATIKDQDWTALVEDTRWMSHVRNLLSSAWTVAVKAHSQRTPVLVHCSHGWDRTSQVVSLAQMLLDPYYRTMDGFQVLIEKDWLAFGHPFHLRHAYGLPRGVTSGKEDQRSPIFLQFLDCTWQLVMQLPSHFEFNPRYLLCIADHIQSCRFGTFLCNTDKARREAKLEGNCSSLWTFLELHRSSFLSRLYQPSHTQEELLPPLPSILRHVRLWNDYFLRWSPAPSFMPLPLPLRDGSGSSGSGKNSPSDTGADGDSHLAGGGLHLEQSCSALPMFRCEYDEMERWIAFCGQRAEDERRKGVFDVGADADEFVDAFNYSAAQEELSQRSSGAGVTSVSERAASEELALALKEIERLKAALDEEKEIVSALLMAGTPEKPPRSCPSCPHTAPTKQVVGHYSNNSFGDHSPKVIATTGRARSVGSSNCRGSGSGSFLAAEAAKAAAEAAEELDFDDGEEWLVAARPRRHSSMAESREVRRSSLNEKNNDEDRSRCLTGASMDVNAHEVGRGGGAAPGYGGDVMRNDRREGPRTNSSWKWDFKGWGGAGSGGGISSVANGTILGRKSRTGK